MISTPNLNKVKEDLVSSNMLSIKEILGVMRAKNEEELFDIIRTRFEKELGTIILKEIKMNHTEIKIFLNPKCQDESGNFSFTFKEQTIISQTGDPRIQVTDDITIGEIKKMFTKPEEIWGLEINL